MKHLFPLLLCALLLTGTASAQRRFQVGVRGGVTTTSYTFSRVEIGENRFRPGPAKAGYQAGLVLWFNLTRRLHLQSELNFAFVNYSIRAEGPAPAASRCVRSGSKSRCSWASSSGLCDSSAAPSSAWPTPSGTAPRNC